MNATDVIGWTTSDGFRLLSDTSPRHAPRIVPDLGAGVRLRCRVIRGWRLDCDRCGAVTSSLIRAALGRSLRDAHDEYTFGTVTVSRWQAAYGRHGTRPGALAARRGRSQ